jgi:hypothetical protein
VISSAQVQALLKLGDTILNIVPISATPEIEAMMLNIWTSALSSPGKIWR